LLIGAYALLIAVSLIMTAWPMFCPSPLLPFFSFLCDDQYRNWRFDVSDENTHPKISYQSALRCSGR
jgi:hypothetical protein